MAGTCFASHLNNFYVIVIWGGIVYQNNAASYRIIRAKMTHD